MAEATAAAVPVGLRGDGWRTVARGIGQLLITFGVVILLFGRKLFWLCVAAVGFAAGVEIAPHLVHEPSSLMALAQ